MSLVVFPFKHEDLAVVDRNLRIAAAHTRVDAVWAVAASEGDALDEVAIAADQVGSETGTPTEVFAQDRIGVYRPGKGDGMNTALRRAAQAGHDRVHFYDADITNFDGEWIESAEERADDGYEVVRHRFPRAATDAMITWMITRPTLAMNFPGTILPRLGQPLGGELLLSGAVVQALAQDALVASRSDWGVDTVITYATAALGVPLYEHNVASGKRHALYGTLDEIRAMALECLDAVRELRSLPPPSGPWSADPPVGAPDDLKETVAYDAGGTAALLAEPWTEREVELASRFAGAEQILANRSTPSYDFMDEARWGLTLRTLLDDFELGDPDWESLAFRLWVMRVLAYTTQVASRGFDEAMAYLERTIVGYESGAL